MPFISTHDITPTVFSKRNNSTRPDSHRLYENLIYTRINNHVLQFVHPSVSIPRKPLSFALNLTAQALDRGHYRSMEKKLSKHLLNLCILWYVYEGIMKLGLPISRNFWILLFTCKALLPNVGWQQCTVTARWWWWWWWWWWRWWSWRHEWPRRR